MTSHANQRTTALDEAAALCDLAAEHSESQIKVCKQGEVLEQAVLRGAILQAKKLAEGIRALKQSNAHVSDQDDTEAHF